VKRFLKENPEIATRVEQEVRQAVALPVNGTPSEQQAAAEG
jgi:hypothetical protein